LQLEDLRTDQLPVLNHLEALHINWMRDEEAHGEAAISAKLSFKRLCSDNCAHSGPSIIVVDGSEPFPDKFQAAT
jgi:hypothetical protein